MELHNAAFFGSVPSNIGRTFLTELLLLIASCVMQGMCVHLCGCLHPYSAWEVYWMTDLIMLVVFVR